MRGSVTYVLVALMIACTRAEPRDAQTESEPRRAPSEPSQPRPAVAPAQAQSEPTRAPLPAQFWIANDGLAAYDLDGKPTAKLGEAPIDDARRLADGRIVGIDDADPLSLVILAADGKVERRIAIPDRFDPKTCKFGSVAGGRDIQPDPLSIQSASEFKLGPSAACLGLQDRNDNMANYRVEVTVDLSTGGVAGTVALDLDDVCEGQGFAHGTVQARCTADASWGAPWIEHAAAAPSAERRWDYDFDETSVTLTKRGKPHAVLCEEGAEPEPYSMSCASLESRSPSGRWVLLSGLWSEGDYIYRELVLLDRSTGVLLQVDQRYEQPTRFVETPPEKLFLAGDDVSALSMIGESDVGWLPEDRLWIDGQLLIPERREIVDIGGNRVRTL